MSTGYILEIVLMIPAILIAFTFHEYAHAITAYRLGDVTPKLQGRLTFNPFSHIDIWGFILILAAGFGWAKPVQTNPSAYKNLYKDDLKVSIAGPLANLFVAVFSIILYTVYNKFSNDSNFMQIIGMIIAKTVWLNCMLLFLNLMPIPGFDGFHILRDLFPNLINKLPNSIYRYGILIFILCTFEVLPGGTSIFYYIVDIPAFYLREFLSKLVGLV